MVNQELKARVEQWISDDIDPKSQVELRELLERGDEAELKDRMAGTLEFGTAGLRGIIAAGSNRMNRAVVVRATAGLAQYLLNNDKETEVTKRGVVIGYDGRRMSPEFAEETASVLAAAGIPVYLFPEYASTPQTAFATTDLRASASVMITASHNPPEYNGYKVYWSNGAQIIPPHDKGIAECVNSVKSIRQVLRMPIAEARSKELVRDVPPEVTKRYLARIKGLSIHPETVGGIRIIYTPLHGVGNATARMALAQAGFNDVTSVPQQAEPDGEFPTVRFPNPEEPGAMDLSTGLAKQNKADLVLANDPDADRLAVAVPTRDGKEFTLLTGNQIGVLLGYYLLAENPKPQTNRLAITSIVSSPMLGRMCAELGVRYEEVLTGFKWIGNKAMELEKSVGAHFVFGYEEALGYTVGDVVRDKDGVGAAAIFSEMTSYYQSKGLTLLQQLENLYRRFGLYVSRQKSVTRKGVDGAAEIAATMERLRKDTPWKIGTHVVEAVSDYKSRQRKTKSGKISPLDLPSSNVLAFQLEGGSRVIARPSGTEPKIKFYFDLRESVQSDEPFEKAEKRALAILNALEKAFLALVQQ